MRNSLDLIKRAQPIRGVFILVLFVLLLAFWLLGFLAFWLWLFASSPVPLQQVAFRLLQLFAGLCGF